jgi:DNA-binding response OmpR family regulator
MPRLSGFDALQRIRVLSEVPVLMLTARGDETDRIVGLEVGADDYLPKTFSTRELLARLRAVTRRTIRTRPGSPSAASDEKIVILDLEIDENAHSVRLGTELLNLTPLEFDLLIRLARAAGRVLTRDQLLDAVAGRSYEVFDRSIDVHISALRRKLKDNPKNSRFIKTVRSTGYMFCEPDKEGE